MLAAASATRTRPPPAALVLVTAPRPPARWECAVEHIAIAGTRARSVRGLAMSTLAAAGVLSLGLPAISVALLGAGVMHWVVETARGTRRIANEERALGPLARPLTPEVVPGEIASAELRASYHGILSRHEEIRKQLVAAERVQACFRETLVRCGAMAQLAGRLARLADPLEAYLRSHSAANVTGEIDGAARHAQVTGDPVAVETRRREAAVRGRTLGTMLELEAMRDRIYARLDVVSATLDTVAASVIKLHVLDLAEVELLATAAADEAGALAEELEALEATVEEGMQALALERLGST